MPWTPAGSVAVIVAHRFNLTAASQHWLVKEGLVGENDFLEGTIFSDAVVQVRTSRFLMLMLPEQLQFVLTVPAEEEQDLLTAKLGGIVQRLPHIPYKAIGLNFTWHLVPADGDTNRLTREIFYVPDRPLFRFFQEDNARFGGYLSKDFDGLRLKLDVKPIVVRRDTESENRLQFAFNFHSDLGPDAANELQDHLKRWNKLRAETERIIDTVEKREQP